MDINEFILYERKRGDSYRLLSACFYLPKKELFLSEKLFENISMLLNKICPDAAIFSTKMGEAIQEYSDEDLAVEYAILFVGPYELKAPPYGSIYLDQGRRVMGDSTMEVRKMFEEAGLSTDDNFKELPDHISVELEFMYYLIHKEVEALENSEIDKALSLRETQELFLNRFLKPWVPPFCERIKASTDNEFYNSLANCVLVFVDHLNIAENSEEEMPQLLLT
jgi:TorA maturation chaperone TorD